MFELINFFVKKDGQILVENLSCKFPSSSVTCVKCKNNEQKDAFIQGLIGNPAYRTAGRILWDSKWIIEDKSRCERARDKFYWLSDFSPAFDNLKVADYLTAILGSKKRLKKMQFTEGNLYENWTEAEKQRFKLLEINLLHPKVVLFDLSNPCDFVWKEIIEYWEKHSLTLLFFQEKEEIPGDIKIDSYIKL